MFRNITITVVVANRCSESDRVRKHQWRRDRQHHPAGPSGPDLRPASGRQARLPQDDP